MGGFERDGGFTLDVVFIGQGANGGGRKTDVGFALAPNFGCGRPGWRGVGGMYVDVVVRDSTHDENPHQQSSPVNNIVRRALLLACAGRSHEPAPLRCSLLLCPFFAPPGCC